MGERPTISVVVPLYNEQENVEALHDRLSAVLAAQGLSYEVVFIDDGSRDATAAIVARLLARDPCLAIVRLSRNFGHQAAVSAGLDHARGRAVVVMDGDLQDPPEVIPQFVARWREGFDVVYAVRASRREGALKRLGYFTFYRLFRAVSEIDVPLDSGDFCLMDRRVVDTLRGLPERMRFIRGLRTFVGFRQAGLAYDRDARAAGRPKYTLSALVRLAVDGLISFSGRPLRLVTYIGGFTIAIAAGLAVWVFCDAFWNQTGPRGWASLIVVVLFMGSVQLICLGIIGEYIRLIFLESKGRPSYIVQEYTPARAATPERADA
ncbi:MAG: glycosyltransferase family 2 protein [Isosphaeraceae bacterium]|nr:glycosyltransferase family 2 protein [Isosphaeraceae bacterium]